MKHQQGLTIIQLMVALLIAGVVGSLVVEAIIDKRCSESPTKQLCSNR